MGRAFFPCLWCGAAIERETALARGRPPMYCSEPCRKHEPHRSLVMCVYHASENAAEARGFADFADFDRTTRDEYRNRVAGALKQET